MKFDDPITALPGIGPVSAAAYAAAGITSVRHLLDHFPSSYRDYARPTTLAQADTESRLYRVVLSEPPEGRWKGGRHILTLRVRDEEAEHEATAYIFNQPYLAKKLCVGNTIFLYGAAHVVTGRPVFSGPRVMSYLPQTGIEAVYPRIPGVAPGKHRKAVGAALDMLTEQDPYSERFRECYSVPGLHEAYMAVHFPHSMREHELGRRRFLFENGLITTRMLDLLGARQRSGNKTRICCAELIGSFERRLPFRLTSAQRRAIEQVAADLGGANTMNRLLEGDVGSGKTVVALFAMYAVGMAGCQSFLLAPTEILAAQHARSAQQLLGHDGVELITGSMSVSARKAAQDRIRRGLSPYIIGTHALLYGTAAPPRPALVVADEQHRFGVQQRRILLGNEMDMHSLVMSATPIPRSLALALGGMSDISVLDELPPGRRPVETRIVGPRRVSDMLAFVAARARAGERAYIVCPLIESDRELKLRAAAEVYAQIQERFPDVNVGLLHGRMTPADKQKAMDAFQSGSIAVLVTTTVVEVGVDVPEASIMVILDADRFGLAQLHQLRGRVGRGTRKSWCFLNTASSQAQRRLAVLCRTQNGFDVAEADLQERGVGQVLGLRQHGRSPDVLDVRDAQKMKRCREILDEMSRDAMLKHDYLLITERAKQHLQDTTKDVVLN